MPKCSVIGCNSHSSNTGLRLSYHRLPRIKAIRKKWLDVIGEDRLNKNHSEAWLCSLHFEDGTINKTLNVTRLRDNTVPSLFSSKHVDPLINNGHNYFRPVVPQACQEVTVTSDLSEEADPLATDSQYSKSEDSSDSCASDSEPTDPTEPPDPTHPTELTQPTDPIQPTDPTQPAVPTQLTEPTVPQQIKQTKWNTQDIPIDLMEQVEIKNLVRKQANRIEKLTRLYLEHKKKIRALSARVKRQSALIDKMKSEAEEQKKEAYKQAKLKKYAESLNGDRTVVVKSADSSVNSDKNKVNIEKPRVQVVQPVAVQRGLDDKLCILLASK